VTTKVFIPLYRTTKHINYGKTRNPKIKARSNLKIDGGAIFKRAPSIKRYSAQNRGAKIEQKEQQV